MPFPFLDRDHVKVLINGVVRSFNEWIGPARIRVKVPLVGGEHVLIRRETPISEALVEFQNGAVLTEEDLNLAIRQLLYRQQELDALYQSTLHAARVRIGEAGGIAVTPEDAANQIAGMIAADQILNDFRQRIADIDLSATQLSYQAVTLANVTSTTGTLSTLLDDLRTDHDALVGVVDALANLEDGTGLASIIQTEQDARVEGDAALAATIALIGGKSGDNSAFILDLNKVKVSPTESLSQRFSALSAKDNENAAAIQNEASARATAISAEATARNSLAATLRAETAAAIQTEQTARANAISAEATARTTLASTLRSEMAASIQSEASTRANADGVFTSLFTLLGAKSTDGTSFILNDSKVKMSNGTALATRLSGIDTAVANANAAVVNEATARANADSSLSQQISVVSGQFNGLSGTVSTISQVVNGLGTRWGVQLVSNRYVSGVVMNNDGATSDFTVLADIFRVINWANGTAIAPFIVQDGIVKINTAHIYDLHADRIIAGTIRADRLILGSLSTAYLAENAATQTAWASLPQERTLVNGDNVILTLNVPNVLQGELLKVAAMVSLSSADDLRCAIKFYHTPPGAGRYLLYSHDIKMDSDGGASTRIPLQVLSRVAASASGTHTFELVVDPLGNAGFGGTTQSVRAGTDLEVTRFKR